MPVNVFISYSHKDRSLRDELAIHLSNLRNQSLIGDWYDGDIIAGTEWREQITDHLNTAEIILLLISADFMANDLVYSIEMQQVIARHNANQARVIPIILRPCDWKDAPFAQLQVLPTSGQPVTRWSTHDDAFADVVQGIRRAISELRSPPYPKSITETLPARHELGPLTFHRLSNVFVKSGFPEVTFVERKDFIFLKLALEQAGRGIVIEGPSGVGKTTAVEKAVKDLEETKSASHIAIHRILSARNPADRNALQTLREWHNGTVIIDDFHRLDLTLRNEMVDYLKELADAGSKTKKVVIVGIPRTGQSLVDTYFDIATRLDVFTFGQVNDELILQMIEKGEEALNIRFDRKAEIALVANGSLNLAQFICYNLCAIAGFTQTQDQTRVVACDIEAAITLVMKVLASKFEEPIMHFIAMGGPRDLAGLQLLEVLATTEDGFLSLPQLQEKRADLANGIKRFMDELWMEKLYAKCPVCTNLLYFDQLPQALVIDDPQLAFYLKQVRFSTLAKKVGKMSTLAQRKVFISYSHKDVHWLERLQIHLKPIEREGIIDLWDDTKIAAGVQWKDAIMNALTSARVAVLLVSADFLASDFIAEHELPTLLERAQAGGTTIILVILSPSIFSSTSLSAFQAINAPNRPVSSMTRTKQEQVFAVVAQTIMKQFKAE